MVREGFQRKPCGYGYLKASTIQMAIVDKFAISYVLFGDVGNSAEAVGRSIYRVSMFLELTLDIKDDKMRIVEDIYCVELWRVESGRYRDGLADRIMVAQLTARTA